ncbi:MAG: septal ring lytic transglycosylase RlpA family protein [Alphaproteobacteria bacterium]|nr:septal ring lytic transglycosylase RlpA family protein [Alphaproteobacteria bacterium]
MRKTLVAMAILSLTGCSQAQLGAHVAKKITPDRPQGYFKVGNPYKVMGQHYTPRESYDLVETGIASWYGTEFHGKPTANGELFDRRELTAAHRTLQMPSLVRVTNLENGRSLVVRVNDRGPFKRGRIIDLSEKAAELLGFKNQGTARVRLQVLDRESRAIAEAARRGVDTSGVEVALNGGQNILQPTYQTASATEQPPVGSAYQTASVQPVEARPLAPPPGQAASAPRPITGHMQGGRFLPDPVVSQLPVAPTAIFVQTGAFTVKENAAAYASSLSRLGEARIYSAAINGQQFYRVRFGPFGSVSQADAMLDRLASAQINQAMIVVD